MGVERKQREIKIRAEKKNVKIKTGNIKEYWWQRDCIKQNVCPKSVLSFSLLS